MVFVDRNGRLVGLLSIGWREKRAQPLEAVVVKRCGWVVEPLVIKLDWWRGEGSSRADRTVRTVICPSRVVLGDSKIGRGG